MSKSRTKRTKSNDWPVLKPMSDAEKLKRVNRLPAPVRGVVVTVPLMLLPLYFQVWQIEPKGWNNPTLIVGSVEDD